MFWRPVKDLTDVVGGDLCVGCGACAYVLGRDIEMTHIPSKGYRPSGLERIGKVSDDVVAICPGAHVNADLASGIAARASDQAHEIGSCLEVWEGWAADPEIRFRGSSGGVLTALALYCLEAEGFTGVVHSGMNTTQPWMNRNYISRNRADLLERAGSRYAPSAPLAGLRELGDGLHLFIGKPCDTAALSEIRRRDKWLDDRLGLVLTFFCAGTPSTQGTLDLLERLRVDCTLLSRLDYRGEGWPGTFRTTLRDGTAGPKMSYEESWASLTSYRPLRCNMCPDGLGRVADIACGDAWHHYSTGGDPGRSLILVRTPKGKQFLAGARRDGYVVATRATAGAVISAQGNLLARRQALFGRLAALALAGRPVPRFEGFALLRGWLRSGPYQQAVSILGTLRRLRAKRELPTRCA